MLSFLAAAAVEAATVVDPWYIEAADEVRKIVVPAVLSLIGIAVTIITPWVVWRLRTIFAIKTLNEAAPSVQRSIDAGIGQELSRTGVVPVNGLLHPEAIDRVVETVKRDNATATSAAHDTDDSLRKKVEASAPAVVARRAEDLERIRNVGRR